MRYPDDMSDVFNQLTDLSPLQRYTIRERYRFLMKEYRRRCRIYAALFYVFRITMTVGSLAVPALLSIQNTPGTSNTIYWFAWAVSLAVTTANGITTLFKLDKRFFMLHATAERLRSETWQYVQLSGRYSGHHGHHKPTHLNQYVFYCSQLEKINMKRINEEFIKSSDDAHPHGSSQGPTPQQGQKVSSETLVPSPPDLQTPNSKASRRESDSILEDGDSPDYQKKKKGEGVGSGSESGSNQNGSESTQEDRENRENRETNGQTQNQKQTRGSVIALQMQDE
jgi:hypothetical protein